jgi:hypothetical protein
VPPMSAGPFRVNLTIYQGSTFLKTLTWKTGEPAAPVDLTGCSARMQVRQPLDSSVVLLELTTGNGRIALGGAAGTVELSMTAADTAALTWPYGVYDLEIVHPGGDVRRLLAGKVKVVLEVTR